MKRTGTFKVDHLKMREGIYRAGTKKVNSGRVVTYDIRVKVPYKQETMSFLEMHSVEHMLASALDEINDSYRDIEKLYIGPMGCCTGFYFLIYKKKDVEDIRGLEMLDEALNMALKMEEVPFNSEEECGNKYTLAQTEDELNEVKVVLRKMKNLVEKCLENRELDEYIMLF